MKNKKMIIILAAGIYAALLAGVFGYASYEYRLHTEQMEIYASEIQQIETTMENIEAEIETAEMQADELQAQMDEKQKVLKNYKTMLTRLDQYAKKLETVRAADEWLLSYEPLTLVYNYDASITSISDKQGKLGQVVTTFFPNIFTSVVSKSVDAQNVKTSEALVQINQKASEILSDPLLQLQRSISNLCAAFDLYDAFLQSQDMEEEFVNLYVMDMLTETNPIEEAQFQKEREEVLAAMVKYYHCLDAVSRMYELFLSDIEENQDYVQDMRETLAEMETIFAQYGVSDTYSGEWDAEILQIQQMIKTIMDKERSRSIDLPGISDHRFQDIRCGNPYAARVRYSIKSMDNGTHIVAVSEDNAYHFGDTSMVFDAAGEPVYVAVNDEHAYFYQGYVLESTFTLDIDEVYTQACYFQQHADTMTSDEYVAHTLLGR